VSEEKINVVLEDLHQSCDEILVSMVTTQDGLAIAYKGRIEDPDYFGAYFAELQRVCEKVINEVDYANVREVFIRSESGCVCLLPIETKGYLACMSTPKINSTKLQLLTLRTINRVIRYL